MSSRYEKVSVRDAMIHEKTGLPIAEVKAFRKGTHPETTSLDRKIGSVIRKVNKSANAPEVSWAEWMRVSGILLTGIKRAIRRASHSLKDAIDAIVIAVENAIDLVAHLGSAFHRYLERFLAFATSVFA